MRRLAWVSRSNTWEQLSFPPDAYSGMRIKPDGTAVAIAIGSLGSDIWLLDLTSPPRRQRFISHPRNDGGPVWSPDGQWLYFTSDRSGLLTSFRQRMDGTSEPEFLVREKNPPMLVNSISPDQSILIGAWRSDIVLLRPDGNGKPEPLLNSSANESDPAISPDGKWLLDRWLKDDTLVSSWDYLRQWREMLTEWPFEKMMACVLDPENGQALRQCSPLGPVLTPRERWVAFIEADRRARTSEVEIHS